MNRVVITGIAPIAAMGQGQEFFDNLMAMKPVVKQTDENYCKGANVSKWYVPYPQIDFTPYRDKLLQMPILAPLIAKSAAVSTIMALDDAKLKELDPDTPVFFGFSTPNADENFNAYNTIKAGKRLHPSANLKSMGNAISAWISILFGIHGKSKVISTACASGTDAIGEAYEHICMGKSKTAICGASDMTKSDENMVFRSFDVLGTLTHSDDGKPRPFSEERSGFLFCEGGACALILEEYESALARGADIYAEITGYRSCCDGYHIVKMPDYPEQVIKMLKSLSAGKNVDYYNAHGTATSVNDQMETTALTETFGEHAANIIINATKCMTGHAIGTSSAYEAAVTAYSIKNGIVHGNILGTPMEGFNLPQETTHCDIRCAITASFGFGGHNSALMMEKI